MAERITEADSLNAIEAAGDILHASYDMALTRRLNASWDKDAGDFDPKSRRLDWLNVLNNDLTNAGEEGTDCSIHTKIWLRILKKDLNLL